ncbi:hypothetical protein CXB51_019735 [Gossypium anomalum]|uniref:G-patch domain-containing protein n=1 Tax=Gossypium anomalum TaxID=47600 RepID=A0A8J5YPI1_9ROSI|nr:hypothetical protein CXB51_019735 [Gossypium anomalum]
MEKGVPSSVFVNDGSFMERFKQLQQQKDEKDKAAALEESKPPKFVKGSSASKPAIAPNKIAMECKPSDSHKTTQISSGGKLAFSLKQKLKFVAPPLKLAADDEEEEDQAAGKFSDDRPLKRKKLAPPSPTDPIVKKLASFVAKMDGSLNMLHVHFLRAVLITNTINSGLLKRKKLFYRTRNRKVVLLSFSCLGHKVVLAFQLQSLQAAPVDQFCSNQTIERLLLLCPSSAPPAADPITMMEFYMKKAAEEEKMRLPKQPKDEMLPPPSLQDAPIKKGHSLKSSWLPAMMLPHERLALQRRQRFKLIMLGINSYQNRLERRCAHHPGEVTPDDDIYEQYKKRMTWFSGEGLGSSKNGISDPIMAGDVKMCSSSRRGDSR